MHRFEYDEATHTYSLVPDIGAPRILPSVTKILQSAGMYGFPRTDASAKAMNKGSFIHKLTELVDVGAITAEDVLEEDGQGYIIAYQKFVAERKPKYIFSEVPMYHGTHLFAGKIDRGAVLDSIFLVLDIKTGTPHPAYLVQEAAYVELAKNNDHKVSGSASLYLSSSGEYTLIPNTKHLRAWQTFLCALAVYSWKEENLGPSARNSN